MQVPQVLQARHLFACSSSSNSNNLKVIELLVTKSLPEDSLYSTTVVDTYDILPWLHSEYCSPTNLPWLQNILSVEVYQVLMVSENSFHSLW
jgi:hypothetical protein